MPEMPSLSTWHITRTGVLVPVWVTPHSHRNELSFQGETLHARLTAPPVEGAANAALITLLATHLGLPKHHIAIVRGAGARRKTIAIAGLPPAEIWRRLRRD